MLKNTIGHVFFSITGDNTLKQLGLLTLQQLHDAMPQVKRRVQADAALSGGRTECHGCRHTLQILIQDGNNLHM